MIDKDELSKLIDETTHRRDCFDRKAYESNDTSTHCMYKMLRYYENNALLELLGIYNDLVVNEIKQKVYSK